MPDRPSELTNLLNRAAHGDRSAAERVFAEIHGELRRLASIQRRRMRPPDATLATTALVNEAYLRLMGKSMPDWNGRHHFFCTAARSMRDILVEDARRRLRKKRGGGQQHVELDENVGPPLTDRSPEEVLELDLALGKLERALPEDHEVVMLRYFAGLSMPEIADILGRPLRTIERRWQFCRAWLRNELGGRE